LAAVGVQDVGSCLRRHFGSPSVRLVTLTEFYIDISARPAGRMDQAIAISSLWIVRLR
jgi:hypothetical protein